MTKKLFVIFLTFSSIACPVAIQGTVTSSVEKLSFDYCIKEVESFSFDSDKELCDCVQKYRFANDNKVNEALATDVYNKGAPFVMNAITEAVYIMQKTPDTASQCRLGDKIKEASCFNTEGYKKILSRFSDDYQKLGFIRSGKNRPIHEVLIDQIADSTFLRLYDVYPDYYSKKSCIGTSALTEKITLKEGSLVDINTACQNIGGLFERFCKDSKNQESTNEYCKNKSKKIDIDKERKDFQEVCKLPFSKLQMNTKKASELSTAEQLIENNTDRFEIYQKISYLCSNDKSVDPALSLDLHYIINTSFSAGDQLRFEPVDQLFDYQRISLEGPSVIDSQLKICESICNDAPGPYSKKSICDLKDLDKIMTDLKCDETEDPLVVEKCIHISEINKNSLELEIGKRTREALASSNGEDIIVDEDYNTVYQGIPASMLYFFDREKSVEDPQISQLIKPDLPTESQSTVAPAENESLRVGEFDGDIKDSSWAAEGQSIRNQAVSATESALTSAPVSEVSALRPTKVAGTTPQAKKINELIARLKTAQNNSLKYAEKASRLKDKNSSQKYTYGGSNTIKSLGGFDNNYGVGGTPAERGYNNDGTSFKYPNSVMSKLNIPTFGGGRVGQNSGASKSAQEQFRDGLNRRGMTTNISGQGIESKPVDGVDSGGGGGSMLSRGPASSGGVSNRSGGDSSQSPISKLFQGIIDGKNVREDGIKDLNVKQVRVYSKDQNIMLEDLLLKHNDIGVGEAFIVYELRDDVRRDVKLIPIFSEDEFQGYKIDEVNDKNEVLANRLFASDNFLKK